MLYGYESSQENAYNRLKIKSWELLQGRNHMLVCINPVKQEMVWAVVFGIFSFLRVGEMSVLKQVGYVMDRHSYY